MAYRIRIVHFYLLAFVLTQPVRCRDTETLDDKRVQRYYPKTREELEAILYEPASSGKRQVPFVFETSSHNWSDIYGNTEYKAINVKNFLPSTGADELNAQKSQPEGPGDENDNQNDKEDMYETDICDKLNFKNGSFENWAGTQTRSVVHMVSPRNIQEIRAIVKCANVRGVKIKPAGSTHSWSPVFADEGQIVVFFDELQSDYKNGEKIEIIRDDPQTRKVDVSVMAGVTIGELKTFQLANKINLLCNTVATDLQVVGVVSTGSHGVGWTCKTPGDYVVKMRIVDSTARLRTYTMARDRNLMRAAQASYGLFGIVYDITLRLDYENIVETRNEYFKVGDVFYNPKELKRIAESSDSVNMFWFPFNSMDPTTRPGIQDYDPKEDDVWVRLVNTVDNPEDIELLPPSYYAATDAADFITQTNLKEATPFLVNNPFVTPSYQYEAFKIIKQVRFPPGPLYQELTHAIHYISYIGLAPIYNMEFAFNFEGDYELITKAIQAVIDIVKSLSLLGKFPLNVALEMRWMGDSDTYMSTASIVNKNYGHVFYLEVVGLPGTEGWEEFCTEIGAVWGKLGGVPHLAKQWSFLPLIQYKIRKSFGPLMEKFKFQLERFCVDPFMMFFSEGLKNIFYPWRSDEECYPAQCCAPREVDLGRAVVSIKKYYDRKC